MKCELIYASNYEEFFYEENDIPVSEGQPVGVEIENVDNIDFILFDDIYWKLDDET
jgi:hypothetical protein